MNEDPNIERRLILAFVLSALVFLLFLPFMEKKTAPPPAAAKRPPAAAPAPTPILPPAAAIPSPTHKPAPAKAIPPTAASQERTFALVTPVFRIEFSNRGGVARSWILTQYTDNDNHPLDLVGPRYAAEHGYPLQFWTPDPNLTQQLDQALFRVTETHPAPGRTLLDFSWSNGTLAARKQLTFDSGYVVNVKSEVTQNGAPVPAAMAWPGNFGDRTVSNHYTTQELFTDQGTALSVTSQKKVGDGQTATGSYDFVGLEDLYFAVAYLPTAPGAQTVTTFQSHFQTAPGAKPVETIGLAFSTGAQNDFHLFVGPKKIDLLKSINPRLRGLVDFGWFSFLADPIFVWMNWTYVHWIHNYGWVILWITFVIMMVMFPFRWKAQKTQIKMSAIQPKIKAINDKMKKYKMNDPRRQELQKEQMQLFQEHGVNPLGGCLPMLLPIVLIWAFYKVLELAIELRHAPWIGYITDLSAKDPYYILPIILVVSQFWSMSLMPMTPGADPKQMKMMKWTMPAVLGYIFFFLPSGVNLYYLCSNAVSVGQQIWINKHFGLTAGGNKIKGGGGGKKKALAQGPKSLKPARPGNALQGTK